jgi:hypothetical protein
MGGNPNVLITTPNVISFKIKSDSDFIIMGSNLTFLKKVMEFLIN